MHPFSTQLHPPSLSLKMKRKRTWEMSVLITFFCSYFSPLTETSSEHSRRAIAFVDTEYYFVMKCDSVFRHNSSYPIQRVGSWICLSSVPCMWDRRCISHVLISIRAMIGTLKYAIVGLIPKWVILSVYHQMQISAQPRDLNKSDRFFPVLSNNAEDTGLLL